MVYNEIGVHLNISLSFFVIFSKKVSQRKDKFVFCIMSYFQIIRNLRRKFFNATN